MLTAVTADRTMVVRWSVARFVGGDDGVGMAGNRDGLAGFGGVGVGYRTGADGEGADGGHKGGVGDGGGSAGGGTDGGGTEGGGTDGGGTWTWATAIGGSHCVTPVFLLT